MARHMQMQILIPEYYNYIPNIYKTRRASASWRQGALALSLYVRWRRAVTAATTRPAPSRISVAGSGTTDNIALLITSAPPEVGWMPSQKTNVDGSQVVNRAQASLTFVKPKTPGLATTSSTRPNRSKSFTPGLPPMADSSAAFIEAAISVPRNVAWGPKLSTAGVRPMSGTSHTTRFVAPASSSLPTIVAMSVA